jgi:Ca2+-binding RTX toxin-like protein
MTNKTISLNVMLVILSLSFLLTGLGKALASIDLDSIDEMTENFTENIKSQVEKRVTEAVNNTNGTLNTSSAVIMSNGSNGSSSQIIVSNNQSVLAGAGQDSLIMNRIEVENGQCTATKVGGSANETLSSQGVCNDQFTGGPGADKFICGQGTDTIRDFSPVDGDTIIDRQSCETVL